MKNHLLSAGIVLITFFILLLLSLIFYGQTLRVTNDTEKLIESERVVTESPVTTNEVQSEIILGRESKVSLAEQEEAIATVKEYLITKNPDSRDFVENNEIELIAVDDRYIAYRMLTVRGPSGGSVIDIETGDIDEGSIPNYLIFSTPSTAVFMDYYALYTYTVGDPSAKVIESSVIPGDNLLEKESYGDCSVDFPPFAHSELIEYSEESFIVATYKITDGACVESGRREFVLPADYKTNP